MCLSVVLVRLGLNNISPVTKYQKEENKSRSKYHNVRVIVLSRPLHPGTAT